MGPLLMFFCRSLLAFPKVCDRRLRLGQVVRVPTAWRRHRRRHRGNKRLLLMRFGDAAHVHPSFTVSRSADPPFYLSFFVSYLLSFPSPLPVRLYPSFPHSHPESSFPSHSTASTPPFVCLLHPVLFSISFPKSVLTTLPPALEVSGSGRALVRVRARVRVCV